VADSKSGKRAEREERLAAELRANLKKRKAQSRTRQQLAESGEPGAPATGAADLRRTNPSVKP
jgi:hypothetical protein